MKFISKNPNFFNEIGDIQESFPELTVVGIEKDEIQDIQNFGSQICVCENFEGIDVIENIAESKCRIIINKDNPDFKNDLLRSAAIFENADDYFLNPEKVLFKEVLHSNRIMFHSAADKGDALVGIDNYCNLLNSPFLTETLQTIFEELFMNAVLDAPREAGAQELKSGPESSELFIGDDGNNLVISCLDYYGSLNPEKFFKRLLQVEKFGPGEVMNMNKAIGGAGIGCSILFGCSSTLIVGISPGKYSRVSCVIPLKTSRKKFGLIKKNIHLLIK